MKLKTIQIKYFLIPVLLMMGTSPVTFSQEADTTISYKPTLYVGIKLITTTTNIRNIWIQSLSDLNQDGKKSFSGSFDLGYSFSRSVGISTGLGFSSYSTELFLETYSNKFNTTDSENEPYERRIEGSDITELQNISFLDIPLNINFLLPFSSRFGFFLQTGIILAIPLTKKYSSSGTFTYTGFYPAYNALLENLPAYGFINDAEVTSEENTCIKTVNLHGGAGAGFQYFINNKIQIALGINYNRSLSNISDYKSQDKFQLSENPDQIRSMMGGSSKVNSQSFGFGLSLRYYLR